MAFTPTTDIVYIPNPLLNAEALVSPQTVKMVEKLLQKVVAKALILVPIETGALSDSIFYEMDVSKAEGVVGADTPYAGYVEFGTIYMDKEPYLRPALDSVVAR